MGKKNNKTFFQRFLPFLLAAAMMFTSVPAGLMANTITASAAEATASDVAETTASAATVNSLTEEIEDGAILHCWCWSFDTIKNNMADIAAAGFSTVQTSPANTCNDNYPTMKIMGNDTEKGTDGCWWWHYQPTDWKIGNYQLGSRDDFREMCAEADKYGIKVIVDVIPNHTTPDLNEVSQDLYNAAGGSDKLYHANGFNGITQWGNRYECTTGQMNGLPDVDTENPSFQKYFLNYLNDLIACGADGFRYDTAKHIGVPSDPLDSKSAQYTSYPNFWPVVTGKESVDGVSLSNADEIFNYGEVLQGDNVPEAEYANYMRQTASSYGSTLRSAVTSNNFSVNNISSWQHASNKLVTWVESHDTYCNAGDSTGLSFEQIRLAWAVIAARKDGTPLFYSRPDGSNSWNNRWGNNVLGAKGNDEFKSTEVAAVNFFRNAMAGKSEYLRNPNGNQQILQVDRGTDGTCIINLGGSTTLSSVPTSMSDGTYTDQVSGRTFTVSGGKLSGQLDGRKVAVIYNPEAGSMNARTEAGNTKFSTDSVEITLTAKNITNTKYSTTEGASGSFNSGDVITVGSTLKEGESVTVTLTGKDDSGSTVTKTFTFTKVGKNIAYIKLPSGWDAPYAYVYNTAGAQNAAWPGELMATTSTNGIYKYVVPDDIEDPLVIFYGGDNSRRYPADMEDGLSLTGSMIYKDGSWVDYEDSDPDDPDDPDDPTWKDLVDGSYDVYFYKPSGWGSTVYCYAYVDESTNNAAWPGAAMTSLGQNVYAYNLPDGWTSAKVMFTDNSSQIPGAQQPGMDWADGKSMLYDDAGTWAEVVPVEDKPEVVASLKDGSSFDTETTTVTLELKNATSGTYILDDGTEKEFTDSIDVVIGKGKIADTDVVIKATATDGTETTSTTFTYTKKFNAAKNGGSVTYTTSTNSASTVNSDALGGKYATNPNNGYGANKTITSASDFDSSTLIAQGVANDDPRIFRGSHEGPVYDTYALYGAWDNTNIYLGWQFTNVTDVVDPAQGYPISDNGKPWNGDIPQMIALNLGTGEAGSGQLENGGGNVWGLKVDFETPIDALLCFSSKPGVGQPSLFLAENGTFSYDDADRCIGFTDGGISFEYEDGFFGGNTITGIKANGYEGYVPSDLLSSSSNWVNFINERHNTSQDTFYMMTIPMSTLGITKAELESNGIGVMHISTFGESGTGSIPMDMSMLDCATTAYSADDSTSAEKEDTDTITVPLARLGAEDRDDDDDPTEGTMTVNFGADRSAPQADTTDLTLAADVTGGEGSLTYNFMIDGKSVQNNSTSSYVWDTTGGTHEISVVVTDSEGHSVTVTKEYDVEGEIVDDLQITSFTASVPSPQKNYTRITLTANATGGTGELQYRFYRVIDGKTTVFRDYATTNTAICNPCVVGNYTLYVDVKDEAGNVVTEKMDYSWTDETTNKLQITSFTASVPSPQKNYTRITLTANATGGTGELQYRFYRVIDGKTTVFRDYATTNTAICNPCVVGNYTLYVDVKDEAGNVVTEKMSYSWTDESTNELKIESFTASVPSPQKNYTRITLTANATGGTGELRYRFYRVIDGKTTVFRDYATANTAICNPCVAGNYTLYVDVKDEAGNVVTEKMSYSWTDEATNELKIESFTASVPSPQKNYTRITLTANATGGTGELQYRFYRVIDGKTTVFRDYATANTAICNPCVVGNYTLYVDVKDEAGNVVTEKMSYSWTDETTNKLQIESFTASASSPQANYTRITLTVNAAGGTGELQYRFYRVIDGKTTIFRDYATTNTAICNPCVAGNYTLYVDVKDEAGNVVTASMPYKWQ